MLIIFFDIKGIVHKESVLAGQVVFSTYCCDILQRLHWLLHHDNAPSHTSLSTREFLAINIMAIPPSTLLLPVFPNEDKTERLPF
jgi:hypothetical protein